jgi:hypothetical protein
MNCSEGHNERAGVPADGSSVRAMLVANLACWIMDLACVTATGSRNNVT